MKNLDVLIGAETAFMRNRVLFTAAELDVFTRLYHHPASASELANALVLDAHATLKLLDALAALGFLEKQKDRYHVTDEGAVFSSDHPETLLPWLLHMNRLWGSWSNLTEIVKMGSGRLRRSDPKMDQASRRAFIGAMHVVGRRLSLEIADAYDASGSTRLLDIGGASGTYTIAFLRKNLGMTAVIFDLPAVMPMAKDRLETEGLLDRVTLVEGDFYRDELPKGCDLALLSAIIHQNSPEQNVDLYQKVFRAAEPRGAILIRDHVMSASRTRPPAGALFAVNMLVNTRGGDTYTFDEVKAHLEAAGFLDIRLVRKGEKMDCLVEARKPA